MIFKPKYLVLFNCLLLATYVTDVFGARPPTLANCSRSWRLTSGSTALAFGAFSIDSGSGTISMSSSGALTVSGDIGLISTQPATTYQIQVDNRIGAACLGFPFTLDWARAPAPLAPLAGTGTDMPLSVFVYEPTVASTVGATFPINVPANSGLTLPFTLTLYGDISTSFLQTANDYRSPNFRMSLTMGTRTKRGPRAFATATSITPISLLEVLPMDFGTVAGGSSASTVVLDTAGARSVTGGAQIMPSGTSTAATFQISGGAGLAYAVSFSASSILESPSGQQMTVTSFTNNGSGTIPAGGIETLQVGATLNLNPAQQAGVYSTTTGAGSPYMIIVNYN